MKQQHSRGLRQHRAKRNECGATRQATGIAVLYRNVYKDLSGRLKRMGYIPQDKRRTYRPKAGSEKGRPLAISVFEDKIAEMAVKRVLEQIYEPIFLESSYGYRKNRNPH